MDIQLKRAYDPASPEDGHRVLVERLWPRGIKKENLQIETWMKEISPSPELRKWFGHDPEKWAEFQQRYTRELDQNPKYVQDLRGLASRGRLTLIYSAKDEQHNSALILKEYLEKAR
jgi:uncharacterized protein YeaO (DUF488 family)